jgi:hypothetical protein
VERVCSKGGDRRGSNPRRPEPQSGALPTELRSPYQQRPPLLYHIPAAPSREARRGNASQIAAGGGVGRRWPKPRCGGGRCDGAGRVLGAAACRHSGTRRPDFLRHRPRTRWCSRGGNPLPAPAAAALWPVDRPVPPPRRYPAATPAAPRTVLPSTATTWAAPAIPARLVMPSDAAPLPQHGAARPLCTRVGYALHMVE